MLPTMQRADAGWAGFSPAPMSVAMASPDFPRAGQDADSPLVFKRTPTALQKMPCQRQDSSQRFQNWVQSTSPYAGRKTPPTASMKSCAAGGGLDENTPPVRAAADEQGGGSCASDNFRSWLRATGSTSWTPRKSPAAGTPPPAPAPSPAGATPMSILQDLPSSAATPAAGGSGGAGGGHSGSDSEDDADLGETSTTVGAAELDAGARRAAAAQRLAAAAGRGHQGPSTPPPVPASTPVACMHPAAGGTSAAGGAGRPSSDQRQTQLLQAAAYNLSTPLSQLSLGRHQRGARSSTTPSRLAGADAGAGVSSPAEKLIGLMLSPCAAEAPGAGTRSAAGHSRGARTNQQGLLQHTPSRLAAAEAQGSAPPASPNLQVIDLMMQPTPEAEGQQEQAVAAGAGRPAAGSSECDDAGSSYCSESNDEMDVFEAAALCGSADTPLSAILGMMLTPAANGLNTSLGASAQPAAGDELNPRVLFGDD